ncbi:hypothetical protein [Yersinia enterocolitica]|uniref:hypothetical protein n=1 Tax=Yersinia enterocolitica TaxID=630 RepID=UPI00097606CC|nr:hypothetical protein [Yersinia enterocolitica]HEN3480871.1 hypothetical protein [Yersinia enterocolitica]
MQNISASFSDFDFLFNVVEGRYTATVQGITVPNKMTTYLGEDLNNLLKNLKDNVEISNEGIKYLHDLLIGYGYK